MRPTAASTRRSRQDSAPGCWNWWPTARTSYLATDRETVLERVRTRRGSHSDDYVLPDELAAAYFDHVEPPTSDEGPLEVIR